MVVIFLTFLIIIGVFLYKHFQINRNYWASINVVGPEPFFFFGNIKDFILQRKSQDEVYKEIYERYPKEKVIGIFRMKTPVLLVRDVEVMKSILVKDFDAFGDRGLEYNDKELGGNLFHATGDTWRMLRQRFTGLFTAAKLKNMMNLMTDRGDKLLVHIDEVTGVQTEQDVCGLMKGFALSNISACAFGMDIYPFTTHQKVLKTIDDNVFTVSYFMMLEINYPGILKRIGVSPFPKCVSKFFLKMTEDIIRQRNGEPTEREDFMDLMLTLRKEKHLSRQKKENDDPKVTISMTAEMMSAQSFIFFVGGYESSSMTLSYMLYHLALNPDIQDKAVAEIEDVLRKHDGKVTYEAVSNLSYLDQIIDETLRMHPIVSTIRRCALVDCCIPGTNVTVKKGQIIMIPVNAIHMDEKYYSDPEVFDPERFSAVNKASIYPGAYLPFGLGQRQCVGMRFAQTQIKVCMMKLLSQFRVEPSKNTPKHLKCEPKRILQNPLGGLRLNLIRRH